MANIDAAFGLRPYKMIGNRSTVHSATAYRIQTAATAGTSSTIYQGTPVIPLANGMIDVVGNANGGTVPLLGAFWGVEYVDLAGTPTFTNKWPGTSSVKANTVAWAFVYDDPDMHFLINCDAAAADSLIHVNANFATATSGNATTGVSTGELAVSTAATTSTLNLRIMGFDDQPSSDDATVAGRLAIVRLNVHHHRTATGI
jgi:hypothetical protein